VESNVLLTHSHRYAGDLTRLLATLSPAQKAALIRGMEIAVRAGGIAVRQISDREIMGAIRDEFAGCIPGGYRDSYRSGPAEPVVLRTCERLEIGGPECVLALAIVAAIQGDTALSGRCQRRFTAMCTRHVPLGEFISSTLDRLAPDESAFLEALGAACAGLTLPHDSVEFFESVTTAIATLQSRQDAIRAARAARGGGGGGGGWSDDDDGGGGGGGSGGAGGWGDDDDDRRVGGGGSDGVGHGDGSDYEWVDVPNENGHGFTWMKFPRDRSHTRDSRTLAPATASTAAFSLPPPQMATAAAPSAVSAPTRPSAPPPLAPPPAPRTPAPALPISPRQVLTEAVGQLETAASNLALKDQAVANWNRNKGLYENIMGFALLEQAAQRLARLGEKALAVEVWEKFLAHPDPTAQRKREVKAAVKRLKGRVD
jgi:hypothetical protein